MVTFFSLSIDAQYLVKSKSVSGKKTVIKTEYAPGYITDMMGQEREGEIQLKIVNSDTTEVRLKTAAGKEKFERFDIQYFGLRLKEDYFKRFKDHRKNFHKGYYIDNSGKKVEGRIALRYNEDITGKWGDKLYKDHWKVYMILFENEKGYIKDVWPENVSEIGQEDENGKVVRFERQSTVWSELLTEGGKYTVLHNPFPEVVDNKKTSKANFWKSILGRNIAMKMAGSDVRMSSHTGNQGILVVYGYEYIIRTKGQEKELTVNDEKHIHWIEQIFSKECPEFDKLKKRQINKFRKWENFESVIDWANENCK